MDYRDEAPEIIRGFLTYHETVKGHSRRTVDEYYLDLRMFFRFIKRSRHMIGPDVPFDNIGIDDLDLELVASVKLSDVYDYLSFLTRDRAQRHNSPNTKYGLSANSRARKIAAIRSFYKYLTVKTKQLQENPVQDLDSPKQLKTLPRF
ncbi:MAG: site-specific integrase, partial [Oscillospiraceae bacterium]|nr:site-specific integrase [Oscillospiraceae bacterium]